MNSGLSPVALGSEGDIFWGQYQSCSLVLMWQIAKSWGFEVVIFSVGFWLHGDFVCFTHENNAITSAFIIQSFRFRLLLQRRNKLPFEPAGGWHMWLEFFLSQAISFPRPQEVEPDKWGSPQDRVGQWVESWHAPSRGMIPCCFFFHAQVWRLQYIGQWWVMMLLYASITPTKIRFTSFYIYVFGPFKNRALVKLEAPGNVACPWAAERPCPVLWCRGAGWMGYGQITWREWGL